MSLEAETAKAQRQGRRFVVLPPNPYAGGRKSAYRKWRLVAIGGKTAGHSFHQRPKQKLNSKILYQHSDRERVIAVTTELLGADGFELRESVE